MMQDMDHVQFLKHFLHVNIKLLQHQLLIIFFSTFAFVPLLEISCPYMYGSISGVSILSRYLFIYLFKPVLHCLEYCSSITRVEIRLC